MEVKSKGGKRNRTSSGGGSRTTAATAERKEIERKRRQHMKGLCDKLASLIPKEHYSSKDTMTQLGILDEAAEYLKKLKKRVDELQHKTSSAQLIANPTTTTSGSARLELEAEEGEAPVVEVRHHDDSSMDLVLICNAERPFRFHEVITILEEEGAEIVNANYSVVGQKIFYTIYSRAFSSRIGIEVSRVSERLRALA